VSGFHKQHPGLNAEEAMLQYLKVAQDLEMFGITYFPVINSKNTDVLVGVDALGLNFYSTDDKLNPKVSFPWSEITNTSVDGPLVCVSEMRTCRVQQVSNSFSDSFHRFQEHQGSPRQEQSPRVHQEDQGLRGRQQRDVQEEKEARAAHRAADEGML
jgi:hypothetical protein